jgi:hypothetical protein
LYGFAEDYAMNIFYLDEDPKLAARYHCDKHVPKMILEYAQMLSLAQREAGNENPILYKPTHRNHPASVWVRSSLTHYRWLYELFDALSLQYVDRFNKVHLSYVKLSSVLSDFRTLRHTSNRSFTAPPLCMPDEYKGEDAVEAYRRFYIHDKSRFARWERGVPAPEWYETRN